MKGKCKIIMKMIIKKLYMLFRHPYIFFLLTIKNNFLIGARSDVRHIDMLAVGKNVRFGYDTRINFFDNSSNEKKLIIGDNCYFCNRCSFLVGGKIELGKDVLVASDVCFVSENHGMDPDSDISYQKQALIFDDISIGDGSWIGEKAMILSGVKIGRKCIIAGGAIVTKCVPDLCIVAGNPARIIKKYNEKLGMWEKYDKSS